MFLPLVQPSTEFEGEIGVAGGWTAFVGATVFEVGSVLLMLEAVNENREGCFGWAVERAVEELEGRPSVRVRPEKDDCRHHHGNRRNLVGAGLGQSEGYVEKESSGKERSWQWWPTWKDLTEHYIYQLGFLACLSQLVGATVFWISGFTALPYIFEQLSQNALDGVYWVPQIVGGAGFTVSGCVLYYLIWSARCQKRVADKV